MDHSSEEKVADATHVPERPGLPPPQEMSIGKYAATRISTLKPPMNKAPNPFRLLEMLSGKQWLFFLVGFLAWVCLSDYTEILRPRTDI
jgi:SHS family lactate transporter-like MFS transporter